MKKHLYNKTIVVNLFGGPGRGKSALCAGLFYSFKKDGIDCEIAWEYAKGKVWEGSMGTLENQLYMFAKQQHQLFRLEGKVQVVITDAPLLISAVYDETHDPVFLSLIESRFNRYTNLNYLLLDKFSYNENGRLQTESGSDLKHDEIIQLLRDKNIEYTGINQSMPDTCETILADVKAKIS